MKSIIHSRIRNLFTILIVLSTVFLHNNNCDAEESLIKNLSYSYYNNQVSITWMPFASSDHLIFKAINLQTQTELDPIKSNTNKGVIEFLVTEPGLYKIDTTLRDSSNSITAYGPNLNIRIISIDAGEEESNDTPPIDPVPPTPVNDPIPNTNEEKTIPISEAEPKIIESVIDTKEGISNVLIQKQKSYEIYNDLETYQQHSIYIDIPPGIDPEEFFRGLQEKYGDIVVSQPFLSLGITTYRVTFRNTDKKNSELLSFLDPYVVDQGGEREWPIIYHTQQQKTLITQVQQASYLKESGLLKALTTCTLPSKKTKVAVIDNAFDTSHEDFGDAIIHSYDVADEDTRIDPPKNTEARIHGTVSASIIGAEARNTIGIIGSSLDTAELLLFKATSNKNRASDITHGMEAIAQSVEQGADIINISRGAHIFSKLHKKVIEKALAKGVVIIASAGNYNKSDPFYPAAYKHVISIASVNDLYDKSDFSNFGSWVTLSGPGEKILGLGYNQSIGEYNGTSEAAPFVAGLISFLLAYDYSIAHIPQFIKPHASLFEIGEGVLSLEDACKNENIQQTTFKTQSLNEQDRTQLWYLLSMLIILLIIIIIYLLREHHKDLSLEQQGIQEGQIEPHLVIQKTIED